MNSIEVIDIESSDDGDGNNVDQKFDNLSATTVYAIDQSKEDTSNNSKSITIPATIVLLEDQRKSIDKLFESYADCHNKLLSLTSLMNPLQRRRWQKHMTCKQVPIVIGGPEEHAEEERESNFEDDEDDNFARLWDRRQRRAPGPSSYSGRVGVAPKRRKKARKKTVRRVNPKREAYYASSSSASKRSASSSISRGTYSSADGSSSRPSTSSTTDRKPSKNFLTASLARFVMKRER